VLRITGGIFKGYTLFCPKNIRPTSARVKEYIFSQVSQYTIGSRILDLFAGSGALGIEAMSRRAREVCFVDKSRNSVNSIKRNLEKFDFKASVHQSDFFRFVKTYKGEPFDLVFVDPPYLDYKPETILKSLEEANLIKEGGHLVYELGSGGHEPETDNLMLVSLKTHGDTTIGIWYRKG